MDAQPGAGGKRFAIYRPPSVRPAVGLIVYVHPLCEEMNKSRRMVALQSRALAQAGFSVLQVDLHGCGDSSGDFGDATWADWVDDVTRAARWLGDRHALELREGARLWLWGLRAGCLLLTQAAAQLDMQCHLLMWQPALAGKLLLQQFLRLRLAASMQGGQGKGLMQAMRQDLAAGRAVEVAGYRLHPELASGLETATLEPPERAGRTVWIDVAPRADVSTSPASIQAMAHWQAAGWQLVHLQVQGPAFWQTTEIEDAPALIAATIDALSPA